MPRAGDKALFAVSSFLEQSCNVCAKAAYRLRPTDDVEQASLDQKLLPRRCRQQTPPSGRGRKVQGLQRYHRTPAWTCERIGRER